MNKKTLCAALLGALGLAQAVSAQEVFDDRWYVSAGPNVLMTDNARGVEYSFGGQFGVGRFFSPNWSFDVEAFSNSARQEGSQLNWNLYGVGMFSRYHFRGDANWWPYVSAGVGALRHEEQISDPLGGQPFKRKGTNLFASLGGGLQADITDRLGGRLDLAYRADFDDESSRNEDWFGDVVLSVSFMYKFGDLPQPPPPPAPPPPPPPPVAPPPPPVPACPPPKPGQAVGPDGCPIPLTIDLRGVNFDFDKATLRPDAVQILNEAIEILRNYPELRVEVAGHTDSIGTEQYNQRLSERRARTVYDFLTANGISANRLVGPVGHGEARPIAPNTTPDGRDNPEGRAQNRRTELNVQN